MPPSSLCRLPQHPCMCVRTPLYHQRAGLTACSPASARAAQQQACKQDPADQAQPAGSQVGGGSPAGVSHSEQRARQMSAGAGDTTSSGTPASAGAGAAGSTVAALARITCEVFEICSLIAISSAAAKMLCTILVRMPL